jgi:hypothetical protein
MRKFFIAFSILTLFGATAFTDELYLKSGEILNAEILSVSDSGYVIKYGNLWKEISKNDVAFVKNDSQNGETNAKTKSIRKNEFIIKTGGNFKTSIDTENNDSHNPSFSSSDSLFLGADFFMPLINNLSLGAGTKISLISNVGNAYGNFSSFAFFITAKAHAKVSGTSSIYSSFNIGTSFIQTSKEFLLASTSGRDIEMMPYFGLNLGLDLNRFIFEIGFSFESYKIARDANSAEPDSIYINRASAAIGYRI